MVNDYGQLVRQSRRNTPIHGFRVTLDQRYQDKCMKTKLRNVTVTLEEKVARWARIEAARQDMSVSRLLAGILKERMREKDSYERAMREALARKPFPATDGRYPKREEIYDRARVR